MLGLVQGHAHEATGQRGRRGRGAASQAVLEAPARVLRQNAPEGIELDDLLVLGPINVFKLKTRPKGVRHKLAVELWNYPDGTRILELSTKCPPAEAFDVAAAGPGVS